MTKFSEDERKRLVVALVGPHIEAAQTSAMFKASIDQLAGLLVILVSGVADEAAAADEDARMRIAALEKAGPLKWEARGTIERPFA